MNYIGMDIHKQFTVAVVKDEQGNKLNEDKFDNSEYNFGNFMQQYKPEETKIVIESTGVWEYIYEILEAKKYEVKLANPSRTRAIAEARIKTDSVDAETLADLLRANLIAESYIPPKEIRKLREVTRERRTFVKQTTQIKNRIHAILIKRGIELGYATLCESAILWIRAKFPEDKIILHYIDLLEYHKKKLEEIDKTIAEKSYADKNAKLLMTIPGIGTTRSLDIVAEIGEIDRFSSANHLSSYAGLVPSIRQSGNTLHFGRLIKQASKTLKYILIETSWSLVRTKRSNQLQEFYKKLAKKKGKQKAICATARKLCCTVYAILRKQEEFRYS
ncbi:IS110 family transposase [Candidatus Woesearchaeota archaeon]|nr:IS110 family transposase [Candidatus Woesearchaeota archaeon]